MPAFPDYDAARLAALETQAGAILAVFAAKGYARVEPAILQPADIFLDRSGEEIRRRTFVFTDVAGRELCLRPDLTIPVCRTHVAAGGGYPARLCYNGPAFRQQPNEPERPAQFQQAGAEYLGATERESADGEILGLAVDALRAAGLERFDVKIGDLGLFAALIDALEIPEQWRARLKRHFWRPGYFEALVERLARGAASDEQLLLAHLGALGADEARPAIEGLMDMIGGAAMGGRTREEIVDRLMEQAADAAALRLDPKAAALISDVLKIEGPAPTALGEIRSKLSAAGIAHAPMLAAMERRLGALAARNIAPEATRFAARFGRNMEYYTGFVFELWAEDAEGRVQVAGGGRYDTLLRSLGEQRDVPAVGCAIRTERVMAARRAGRRG